MHPKNTIIRFQSDGTALIPLSKGKWAIIDAADAPFVSMYSWHLGGTNQEYARSKVRGQIVYMHRLLLSPRQDEFVDHVNRNPLDNRRANLRIATKLQNNVNSGPVLGSRSPYKGVRVLPEGRYRALISFEGQRVHLGIFGDEIQAARAYDDAARDFYGEFAYLNFPDSSDAA